MGRPRLEIEPKQVEALAALQCTNTEIASLFGCDEATIRKRFPEELAKGRQSGRISLRRAQWKKAKGGNATMLIWLGKQWLGQSDRPDAPDDSEGRVPVPGTTEHPGIITTPVVKEGAQSMLLLLDEQVKAVRADGKAGTLEKARSIGHLCTVALRVVEAAELTARIEALESALRMRP